MPSREMPPAPLRLPAPDLSAPLDRLISQRSSHRAFKPRPLTLAQLGRLLWSAQGMLIGGLRVVPSAGATYPLDVVAVVNRPIGEVKAGIYRYSPQRHDIVLEQAGEFGRRVADACWSQEFMVDAPAILVLTCEPRRITQRYGERSRRYIDMEAGHVGQNVSLMAEQLGLGTVMIGAFNDAELASVLNLPRGHEPLYIFPVGEPE